MARLSYNNGETNTKKRSSFLAANPVMRRLDKVQEYSETDCATYGGITKKTAMFLFFTLGGILLELLLSDALAGGTLYETNYKGFPIALYQNEIIALGASVVLAIVFQLLAFFASKTTPVTGSLYCITQGYFISFLIFKVLKGYEYYGVLALIITFVIIAVMALLYSKGIIRVTKKFKMVMLTLLISSIAVSVLSIAAYFIPFTRKYMVALTNNFALSIVFAVLFIIIAALFLICDFNTIDHVVSNKLPKQYEWQAAFGLAFTIVWLYIKVLDLILSIVGNSRK